MGLENINRREFSDEDRAQVQEEAIYSAMNETEKHITDYRNDSRSFDGRYIAADLFKETFPQFSQSNEGRNRYNAAVHNSAAVLSSEQFKRMVQDNSASDRNEVILLTGVMGAGKTSSVVNQNKLDEKTRLVFEGQMAKPESIISKIDMALEAGLSPVIVAVHADSVDALNNTIKRFNESGRGASISLMADIQGNLPDGLSKLNERYGDKLDLRIIDVRDRDNVKRLNGWGHLDVMRSEGAQEVIKERLKNAIEELRETGRVSEDGYRQAVGLNPIARELGQVVRSINSEYRENEQGRSLSEGSSEKTKLDRHQSAHNEAIKSLTQNMKELREHNHEYKDISQQDLAKIAYWRGIVREDNKHLTPAEQKETLNRFDAVASKPHFLAEVENNPHSKIDDRTIDQVKHNHQTEGHSH